MNRFRKITVSVVALLLILGVAAQLDVVSFSYSRLGSSTHNSDALKERPSDFVDGRVDSEVHIERPIWRWIPFVKVGNTVYRHSYRYVADQKTVIERQSTTQTHLWVIGLCSTRKYDELADGPFEKAHREYLNR